MFFLEMLFSALKNHIHLFLFWRYKKLKKIQSGINIH